MREGFTIVDNISIPSDYAAVRKVETLIDKVCSELGVQEDFYGNVLIAVTEAVNNAIQHGNTFQNELEVNVGVADKEDEFCFTVKDHGRGFDFHNLPDPTSPENIEKENGRGIFLMKNLADEVEFEENGTKVNIYFTK
ncbi:MAG: ATP-binding protein [Flavobacteriia bacterium]|nr:ATP-binding protein [Flavobacteriia bacterium]